MKKLIRFISLNIIWGTLLLSCNTNELNLPQVEEEYNYITLNSVIHSSVITEEPLSRAGETVPDMYIVQIYEKDLNYNSALQTYPYKPYAYGIFKSLDDVALKVRKQRDYSISAAAYYRTEIFPQYYIHLYSSAAVSSSPEKNLQTYTDTFIYDTELAISNGMWYIDNTTFWGFIEAQGYATMSENNGEQIMGGVRFNGNDNSINLNLYRNVFGLDVAVSGLDEGTVKLYIYDYKNPDNIYFSYDLTSNKPSISKLYTGAENYMRLSATYIALDGSEVKLIDDEILKVDYLKRAVINIKLNKADSKSSIKATLVEGEIVNNDTIEYEVSL